MIWSLLLFCTVVLADDLDVHPCLIKILSNERVKLCTLRVAQAHNMLDIPSFEVGSMYSRGRGARDDECTYRAYGSGNRKCFDPDSYVTLWLCWWNVSPDLKQDMRIAGIATREQAMEFAREMGGMHDGKRQKKILFFTGLHDGKRQPTMKPRPKRRDEVTASTDSKRRLSQRGGLVTSTTL
ncbi:hypothetical protein MTO96_009324 [Rhipicephalus appendiculatus]